MLSSQHVEHIVKKYIFPMTTLMSRIGAGVLLLMMLLTTSDVFLRKVFSKSILGTVEIIEFMMLILVFFGLAKTEAEESNIRVDVAMGLFTKRTQLIIGILTQFFCAILFVFITWFTFSYATTKISSGEVSQDLWIPVYPFAFIVPTGCAVLAIVLFAKVIILLSKGVRS